MSAVWLNGGGAWSPGEPEAPRAARGGRGRATPNSLWGWPLRIHEHVLGRSAIKGHHNKEFHDLLNSGRTRNVNSRYLARPRARLD